MTELLEGPRIGVLPVGEGVSAPLNIFRTLGHNRPLAKGFLALGGHLLGGGVLPDREREIVILRVGRRCRSEYEFGQHTRIGLASGLTSADVAAVAQEVVTGLADHELDLVAMVDEICADDVVSTATWSRLSSRWTEAELLELLLLAGYYRLVSGVLNSVGVALEVDTPGWPAGVELRRAPRDVTP